MKNLLWILPVIFLAIILRIVELDKKKSHFVVTGDTNISKNSKISKYVSQREVETFAFRHWNINEDMVKNNDKMENLRLLLKSKNTQEILAYMKDNNISVDEPLHKGVTPLMYASFYDDIDTAKELLNLGADPHKKDRHKLGPMAYAMENNSTKAVKLLYENGVKFEEVTMIQTPLGVLGLSDFWEFEPYFDENNTAHLIWKSFDDMHSGEHDYISEYFFRALLRNNQLDILELVLQSGYKPYLYQYHIGDDNYKATSDIAEIERQYVEFPNNYENNIELARFRHSLYFPLSQSPHPRPKIALLRKYNVPIDEWNPSKEFLKKLYDDECYSAWRSEFSPRKNGETYYLRIQDRGTKFLYENCLDKNGTFENIEEYIVFYQQMKIINKITASEERKFGYGNNRVDMNITSDEIKKLQSKYNNNLE